MDLFDLNFLFASLIWGSIGFGYFIFGKKQQSFVPMFGGILMILGSYFSSSAWIMSLVSIGLIVGMHVLLKLGY